MKHDALSLLGGSMLGMSVPSMEFGSEVPQNGTLAVNSQGLVVARSGSLELILDLRGNLYDFNSHLFTAAGRSGRFGPSLSDFVTAYAGTPFIGDRSLFTSENGIQVWTVPANGVYEIRVIGATRPSLNNGGTDRRAIIQGNFTLTRGDKLRILVGQIGDGGAGFGGSGGTFVESLALGLLAVSGGAGASNARQATEGVTTEQAGNWIDPYGSSRPAYGLVGEGGGNSGYSDSSAVSMGGGGASYTHDGPSGNRSGPSYSVVLVGPKSFKNGGAGGSATTQGGPGVSGGFGGGGACGGGSVSGVTLLGWGGGGGYTGGNGSTSRSTLLTPQAGSGGSFLAPIATNPSLTLRAASASVRAGEANIRLVNLL